MRSMRVLSVFVALTAAAGPLAQAPATQVSVSGNFEVAGEIEDGFLLRWRRPAGRLVVLQEPGLPPVEVDAGTIELPEGVSAWVEVIAAERQTRQGVERRPALQPRVEMQDLAAAWSRTGAGPELWNATGDRSPEQGEMEAQVYGSDAHFPGPLLVALPLENDRGRHLLPLRVYPEQYNPARRQLTTVTRLTLAIHLVPEVSTQVADAVAPGLPAAITGQPSVRMTISGDGVHEVTAADLTAAGFDLGTIDAGTLKVLMGGIEQPSLLTGNGDTVMEPGESLLFYGERARSDFTQFPYRQPNAAWIVAGGAAAQRLTTRAAAPGAGAVSSHMATMSLESNAIVTSDTKDVDGDYYFWSVLGSGPTFTDDLMDVSVDTPHAMDEGGTAMLSVRLHGRRLTDASGAFVSDGPHHTQIFWNGVLKDDAAWDGLVPYAVDIALNDAEVLTGANLLRVLLRNDTVDNTVYVNRAELDYRRDFTAVAESLEFTATGPQSFGVGGFVGSDIVALDISDSLVPVLLGGTLVTSDGAGGFRVDFADSLSGTRRYLVQTAAARRPAGALEPPQVEDLQSPANGADWIAICPADLQAALAPLVAQRQAQGLRTRVVAPQAIYDEFNDGVFSPAAIQQFLAIAYSTWAPPAPLHVLLVGDANLDHFDYLQFGGNSVPVFYQELMGKFGSRLTGSDHDFGTVAGSDALADLAVGRLPARSAGQLTIMVNKILGYENSPPAAVSRGVLMVADAVDVAGPFDYPGVADDLCTSFAGSGMPCLKLYREAVGSAAAQRVAIAAEIESGALVVDYFGSSSARQWGFDVFHDKDAIAALTNGADLPFVVSHGTQNAIFAAPTGPGGDPAGEGSMMEEYIRHAAGGGVAAVGAAGGTILTHMQVFAGKLHDELFGRENLVLGEAVRMAKNRAISEAGVPDDSLRMINFFGDPATRLALLADLDGDGVPNLADCAPANGAVAALPAEIGGIALQAQAGAMVWEAATGAATYNIYRGTADSTSPWAWNQECIATGQTSPSITDPVVPATDGAAVFYLVTGRNTCGESTLGFGSGAVARPLATGCGSIDADGDGVADAMDSCPLVTNPGQEDGDGDGRGDACDLCPADPGDDADGDGLCGDVDNCPAFANADQQDGDGDGTGDACALAVNFQPPGGAAVAGYLADTGAAYSEPAGRGWNGFMFSRLRGCDAEPSLASFLFTPVARSWEIDVENGTYDVTVSVKDCAFNQGPQRVTIEGSIALADQPMAAGTLLETVVSVQVTDGRLTVLLDGSGANAILNRLHYLRLP